MKDIRRWQVKKVALENLEIKIKADASDFESGLTKVSKKIHGLKQATNRLGISESFNTSAARSQLDRLARQMDANRQKLGPYYKELERLKEVISNPPKMDTTETQIQLDNALSKLESINRQIEIEEQKISDMRQIGTDPFGNFVGSEKLSANIAKAEANLARLTEKSDNAAAAVRKLDEQLALMDESLPTVEKARVEMERVEGAIAKLEQSNSGLADQYAKVENQIDKAGQAAKRSAHGLRRVGEEAKKAGTKSENSFGKIGKIMSQAIKRIVIMATAYKLIREGLKYLTDGLKTNKQFAQSLSAIKTNLAIAFQPIYDFILPAINALMSAVATATSHVAAFVSALFGKTYSESKKAAAELDEAKKAMNGYGDSAESASGQLASFDKFNDISQKDNASSGTEATGLDFSKVEPPDMSWLDDIKDKFQGIRDLFKEKIKIAVDIAKEPITKALSEVKTSFTNIGKLGAAVTEGFTQAIQDGAPKIDQALTNVFTTGGNLAAIGAIGTETYFGGFNDAFQAREEELKTVFHDGMYAVVSGSIDLYESGTGAMAKFTGGLKEGFENFKPWLRKGWEGLWGGIMDAGRDIWQGITNLWTDVTGSISKALDKISPYIEKFGETVSEIFSSIWSVVGPILGAIIRYIGEGLKNVLVGIGEVISIVAETVIGLVGGILRAFNGLWKFVKNVFAGNWGEAWEGIKEVFAGIWDSIEAVARGAINLIIKCVNTLWDGIYGAIKGIVNTIGAVAGAIGDVFGKDWHFSMPDEPRHIPYLANGGLAYGKVQAVVGDNFNARHNPEVISPLSDLQQMITSAVLQRDISGGGSNEISLKLTLEDGTSLVDALIDPMNRTAKNMGFAPVFRPLNA